VDPTQKEVVLLRSNAALPQHLILLLELSDCMIAMVSAYAMNEYYIILYIQEALCQIKIPLVIRS
jgi:hypothetical protein